MISQSSEAWLAYFQSNVQSAQDMPWDRDIFFPENLRAALVPSIKAFQKGEGSEGHNLHRVSKAYAEKEQDPAYLTCIEYFIREEQKHAEFLRLYLEKLAEKPLHSTWTDEVFRRLRKNAGLEISISVLITAEIIATLYYPALHEATPDPLLRMICQRIFQDEARHIRFQSDRLRMLRAARSSWKLWWTHCLQDFLYTGTLRVVWFAYGQAFRAGKFSWIKYWSMAWRHYRQVLYGEGILEWPG